MQNYVRVTGSLKKKEKKSLKRLKQNKTAF